MQTLNLMPKQILLFVLIVLGVVTIATFADYEFSVAWVKRAQATSPNGKMTAFYVKSGSEAGQAPYGDHIVLSPRYWPFGEFFGETVFAGYCNKSPRFEWISDNKLEIGCETKEVLKQLETFEGISIIYNFR